MTAPHRGIDTTANLTPHLPMLVANGVTHASRYLRAGGITKAEADAIRAAGINLILNFEGAGDHISAFSAATGTRDGAASRARAEAMGAPAGTAIYFSCEPDASKGAFSLTADYTARILPYYRAAKAALGPYRMGAYSFGTWLNRLLADGAIEFCWLPNATGWAGYHEFLASNKWHYLQRLPSNVNFNGLLVDWDDINPAMADIGAWAPSGQTPPVDQHPVLRRGSSGPAVENLQQLLGILADGKFGPLTEAAVKAFQAANGLVPDSIVGPLTWAALQEQRQGV
jgi:hypothetical protein